MTDKKFPSDSALDQVFLYHARPSQPHNLGDLRLVRDGSGYSVLINHPSRGDLIHDRHKMGNVEYQTGYRSREEGQLYEISYPSRSRVRLYYDGDGDLTHLRWRRFDPVTGLFQNWQDVVHGMTYAPFGPLTGQIYGDGGTLAASYDSSYRLTGLTDTRLGATLRDVSYNWTNRDNLGGVTDNLNPTQNETFDYSPRESLASADGAWGELDWLYDSVGNRTQQMSYAGGATTTDIYSYPTTSNQLNNIVFGAGGSRALTYDAVGNVTYDNRSGQG